MEKELRQIRSTAYRQVQEIQGKADAEATRVYGEAFNRDPEFYSFLRTLELYREGTNKNSIMVLTTDSDFYRYLKHASPASVEPGSVKGPGIAEAGIQKKEASVPAQ